MDVESLEAAEAKIRGQKYVINMLQRPDQLEKVDQYMRRISREKASVEAMLKTTMQSQLDGVCSGLNQLQTALQDLNAIKQNSSEIEDSLAEVTSLVSALQDIKAEHMKHSQFAAAMENLKHIFTVPESAANTQTWISDDKLLQAHQSLCDLENSRDDLMFELHKLPNHNPADQAMLKHYFSDVDKLYDLLAKQVWLVMKRTLNTVRKEPTVIVTVMRIIEREEKTDQFALQREKQTGFLPHGRPKRWREKAFKILEEAVQERIEGNQFEERKDNKMWLVRHLEVTRLLVLEDLRVVKTLCVPCFPPEYDILNRFMEMYHNCLARHLEDVIVNGLEGNEYVTLLTWLNTYQGPELLRHVDLNMEPSKIKPLLDSKTVEKLVIEYLKMMEQNFQEWMKKTLDTETLDWQRELVPESDGEGFYHTMVPIIVFQMVDQYLQVAKTISEEMVSKVMMLFMQQVTNFGGLYKDAIVDFKNKYFEDRGRVKFFTQYMIAISNNCLHFIELSHQMKNRYWKPGVHYNNISKAIDTMFNTFQSLRGDTIGFLLDEVFLDLEPHFQELLTRKWMDSNTQVDTICCTIEDYHADYRHLRNKNYDYLMNEAQHRVCKGYLVAIFQRRNAFRNPQERIESAEKLIKEAGQVQVLFERLAPTAAKADSPCEIIISLSEVLKIRDAEMVSLEVTGMVRKYPDVLPDQLSFLLGMRGDIAKSDIKKLVSMIIPEGSQASRGPIPKSLLSEIVVPKNLLDFPVMKSAMPKSDA